MAASLSDRFEGRACFHCGARRGILTVYHWRPATTREVFPGHVHRWPANLMARASCFDEAACRAREEKRSRRSSTRASCIVLVEPQAPGAKAGTCRWCGEPIYKVPPRLDWQGERDRRRSYHHGAKRGEPECLAAWNASRVWSARGAVVWRARQETGGVLRCADCDAVCMDEDGFEPVPWDADHELALEDGGEHVLANLVCRCQPCHRVKTARENAARARARREG